MQFQTTSMFFFFFCTKWEIASFLEHKAFVQLLETVLFDMNRSAMNV